MATSCDLVAQEMGTGVAAALTAVDCLASQVSEQAFGRLFGTDGQMALALTLLLVFYVAFFGISLMLGRSNLSVRALVPKLMTLGLVLTFATSFAAFSSVFYNIFVEGPDEIAGVLTGSEGSATATFAAKLDVVFLAIQEASQGQTDFDIFTPPGLMWMGATMLLLGTVGLLVTARIGLALLLAVGPIFVVLALFNGTRGLFTGWLKGMVMLALVPIFAVIGGSIMLEMAVPILAALVTLPGEIDQQAAMGFFVVGFVHCALMLMSLIVASRMVSGWQVFGLVPSKEERASYDTTRMTPPAAQTLAPDRAARAAPAAATGSGQRRINVSAPATGIAANDTGSSNSGTTRETKVYATSSGSGQVSPTSTGPSRTRGIGNRFRPISNKGAAGGAAPKMESPQ
ncbi:type IV secretion system protein [Erythrobacter sp. YT30]|uniref:type IV secretion system protein n=1 Tax=Erythrobacter sp. YT30 TaxID=1735012 RepID=UPI00076DBD00|nr:type IV secretion system protein [Erythrobacter sp. YT30]KWV90871.1 type VI secretion protein [Erythrobacter sp. YT30]